MRSATALCICASPLAITPAAVAYADPNDDRFLSAIAGQGITGDSAQLIAEAHTVCDIASSHNWFEAKQQAYAEVESTLHAEVWPAHAFLNASADYYCPQCMELGDNFEPGL
ncbi:DUF732 domain-containing protein [Mycobacterium sp. Lab-001]|uniref:DUF732 domain-containing protein n=1 Tax=Mycobacterium sp. Lab-001 TaxID=3410136 RepID=UPI003D173603